MFSLVSRERLKISGLSQRELARLVGISEGHLSLVLSGLREPGPRLLRAWEEIVEPLIRVKVGREAAVASRAAVAGVEVGVQS